jgi:flagellar hook-length control protein FliK
MPQTSTVSTTHNTVKLTPINQNSTKDEADNSSAKKFSATMKSVEEQQERRSAKATEDGHATAKAREASDADKGNSLKDKHEAGDSATYKEAKTNGQNEKSREESSDKNVDEDIEGGQHLPAVSEGVAQQDDALPPSIVMGLNTDVAGFNPLSSDNEHFQGLLKTQNMRDFSTQASVLSGSNIELVSQEPSGQSLSSIGGQNTMLGIETTPIELNASLNATQQARANIGLDSALASTALTEKAAGVMNPKGILNNENMQSAPSNLTENETATNTLAANKSMQSELLASSTVLPASSSAAATLDVKDIVQESPIAMALKEGESVEQEKTLFNQRLMSELSKPAASVSTAVPKQASSMQETLGFNQPGLDQRMGERITTMIGQQIQHARILLDPPELGALEIKIQIQNEQTSVNFVTQTTAAKDVLDAQLPRLREMLESQGMNLDQVDVSEQQSRQEQSASDQDIEDYEQSSEEAVVSEDVELETSGLINYYV